ncbi:MAG: hypothetical protein AAFR17_08795 [Pseudomonadota bacterium]
MPFDLRAVALIQDSQLAPAGPNELLARLRTRFPELGEIALQNADTLDWTPIAHQLAAEDARHRWMAEHPKIEGVSAVFTVDDEPFALMYAPFSFPYNLAGEGLRPIRAFDPADALDRQLAHITISPVTPRKGDVIWTKAQATVMQASAAAICDLVATSAVHWHSSQGFQSPDHVQEAAEEAVGGRSPIDYWMQFYPLRPSNPEFAGRDDLWGMLSLGLDPFTGREIELANAPISIKDAHMFSRATVWMLLDNGSVFRDRETISMEDGSGLATIRDRPEGWMRPGEGIGAYVLVRNNAVIDPETLLVKGARPEPKSRRGGWFRSRS